MSSGDVSRDRIRRLIEEHQEAGAVPIEKLVELIQLKEPRKRPSSTGKYVVRHYDGFDHDWIDVSKEMTWEAAVALWNEKTDGGMRNTCYRDIDYYDIFPSGTRMLFRAGE